jgi:hypothetical protein
MAKPKNPSMCNRVFLYVITGPNHELLNLYKCGVTLRSVETLLEFYGKVIHEPRMLLYEEIYEHQIDLYVQMVSKNIKKTADRFHMFNYIEVWFTMQKDELLECIKTDIFEI